MPPTSGRISPAPAAVGVVIPHWGPVGPLAKCLNALAQQTFGDFKVYLVDNSAALDRWPDSLLDEDQPRRLIPMGANRGFATACNAGWAAGEEPLVVFLNNDAIPQPDWLERAMEFFDQRPEMFFGASLLVRKDQPEIVDDAGDFLDRTGRPQARGRGGRIQSWDEWILSPCGAAAFFRRETLEASGGFEAPFFAYLEDVELGVRLGLMGMRGALIPSARVAHGSQAEAGRFNQPRRIYWAHRNKLWIWLKLFPVSVLIKQAPWLLYGTLRSAIYHARNPLGLGAFLLAHLAALAGAVGMMRRGADFRRSHPYSAAKFEALWDRSRKALES